MYKCDKCDYATKNRSDLLRHMRRKTPCYRNTKEDVDNSKDTADVDVVGENVNADTADIDVIDDTTQNKDNLQCKKCMKYFSRSDHLKNHMKKCDGLDPLQCKRCLKFFNSRFGKCQHMKNVKCERKDPSSNITINNNTTNNTNHINNTNNSNNTNNIVNNITNNIRYDFGKESLRDLQEKEDYIDIMKKHIELGKYAIPQSIKEIYFNDKYPQNQTIKKERRNDKLVSIMKNGEWHTRVFDDVYDDILKKMEKYHDKYFRDLKNEYENTERNREFRMLMYPLRSFAHKMMWYGWKCLEIQRMGIELNEPDDDEEMKRRKKEMIMLLLDGIYKECKQDIDNCDYRVSSVK